MKEAWDNIVEEQFQLAYGGMISISDSDSMSVYERRKFTELLHRYKEEEKKKLE